ncbi:endonuclease/exonuclease/phosphatase family protein [Sphingobacterium sp. UT-1RO-CII-1]|uniref:endonuclease/exonuclease/phosphatase family protein n=1 Tax=Sphingobacterium sp. UT-1RO-CII-1 TaxID=2995225 RepID=UPI00227CCB40|nr:endonuclease/exonuclease/phosphatase family protein [Sphingobacterium sp. UT-1RO-CII-1]MCY4780746.1 endonuclease/exonuclease/phosphatase family protein [Sphingobacterium sp. UT-1RO-CII-1]
MKRNIAFLCALATVVLSLSFSAWKFKDVEIKKGELIMITYNIHHGAPQSSEEVNLKDIADVILRSKADLVALQELDRFIARSGNVDQIAELEQLLNMKGYFSKSIDYNGGEYGVALFSKHPLISVERFDLPMVKDGEQRSLALAKVKLPNDQELYFGSTHLDLNIPNRIAQVQRIKEIEMNLNAPLIIGGDFNAIPTSEEMIKLQESFTLSCVAGGCPLTSPTSNPKRAIDFFAYNNKVKEVLDFKGSEALKEEKASDHIPHVATFEFLN